MTFSGMTEEDLDQVLAIEKVSFASPWTRQAFLFDLNENPFARLVVARNRRNEVVAYGCAWHVEDEVRINNLAVHPGSRGRSIGRFLLRRMLDAGRSAGCRIATLEVRPSNKIARALYESEGFVQIDRRRGYYSAEREDALVLALDLTEGEDES